MLVREPVIIEMIVRLAEHFNMNVATRFIRPLLAPVFSDSSVSRRISDLTDNPSELSEHGVPLDELYLQINAMAVFIKDVRTSILPNMNSISNSGLKSVNDPQKIYRDMALSNFKSNIDLLSRYTSELFEAVEVFDKSRNPAGKSVFSKISENTETARLLQEK